MNEMPSVPTPRIGPFAVAAPSGLVGPGRGMRRMALALAGAGAMLCGQAWAAPSGATNRTASTAELVYLVLVGEMQVVAREPGVGYSLLLEAARKSGDADLYRRSVTVALEARSGDAAKEAARAWAAALPNSADAYRVQLQLLLSGNEVAQSAEPLKRLLEVVPAEERNALIDLVGATYLRAKDKLMAQKVTTAALQPWTAKPEFASSAWAAQGTLALGLGQKAQALDALREGLKGLPGTGAAGLLAVELLNAGVPEAEEPLGKYLDQAGKGLQPVRMAYVRHLLGKARTVEAEKQLQQAVTVEPEAAEPWLLLGALTLQKGQLDAAETHFKRFVALTDGMEPERVQRGRTQAYLSLAQIAEQRKDLDAARVWLDQIGDTDDVLRVQVRRAALLAKQGQVEGALALIREVPVQQASDTRAKLLAEVQVLKDAKQLEAAFAAMTRAVTAYPEDEELQYEQAMLADKLGRADEMERILRDLMVRKPDYHHAFNALGYALADRNTRLDEAKALIEKALALEPGDPFITDSLGWVEYRLGNLPEAERLLRLAFETRADAEIAVHLGEVLWMRGKRDEARQMFERAKAQQADNAVLLETLKRLGVAL